MYGPTVSLLAVFLLGITQVKCFIRLGSSASFYRHPGEFSPNYKTQDSQRLLGNKLVLQLVPDALFDSSVIPQIVAVPSMSLGTAVGVIPSTVIRAIELGGIPAIGMLVVTGIGLQVKTPPNAVGALQHFAAGILLTTVAKELLPEMVKADGLLENFASAFGFFAGVGVLILLGILLPEEELPEEALKEATPSLRNRRVSKKSEAFLTASKSFKATKNLEMDTIGDEIRSGWENMDSSFSQSRVAVLPTEQTKGSSDFALPTALLAAVCIDSTLDGLLVGTSTALDPSTSSILSASLTVESSFLGLTIATAIRSCPAPSEIKLLGTAMAPSSLLLGSVLGGGLAPTMAESPALLAGLLGFGTSATLFMVAEELLLQAHEDGSEHVWWVDSQLYIGFYASVILDKLLGV